ncbi:MAG: 30S ribosomal protein S8 [Planctomycetes bacterium]|nr:30S ribosomal protein S8 [Planctomycetota bacterium]
MTMTDPIGDMLTRIRNANHLGRKSVGIPISRMKVGIAEALKREGFIEGFHSEEDASGKGGTLTVDLKYGPDGEKVINEIKRVSKPSRRLYRSANEIKKVLNGFGAEIYTTNRGVLSDRECREKNVGGEVLLIVL